MNETGEGRERSDDHSPMGSPALLIAPERIAMRIAFVGGGASGETTVADVSSRYAAARGHRVVAVDAGIDQHLAQALGHDGPAPRALGAELAWLEDHLRGDNRVPRSNR